MQEKEELDAMDGALAVILISVAMFVGCFLLGLIPLLVNFSQVRTNLLYFIFLSKTTTVR